MDAIRFTLGTRQRPISVEGYRRAARRALPAMVWAYVDGGADDLATLRENRRAFGRWTLRQRVLAGPGTPSVATTVAGTPLSFPVLLAPTGLNGLSHWQGDLAAARGAERAGTRLVLSSASSYTIEEVAAAAREDHWFQLYPWHDHDVTGRLAERAAKAGYRVLVVTVDVPVLGNREGERLRGMGIPPVLTPRRVLDAATRPAWAYGLLRHRRVSLRNLVGEGGIRAGVESAAAHQRLLELVRLSWDDLAWLRTQWSGPLYVKGVLDPDDAERAVAAGADGVVVSNHGGRQLDGAAASLDALPAVAERVGGRATVLVDGGVRRGSDVVKALCLGADACLVGRAFVYGLAARGEEGVVDVLRILREELERTLVLMGCGGVGELDRSWVAPAGVPLAPAEASE